jgi:TetR/AcrR family transcriptional regulator
MTHRSGAKFSSKKKAARPRVSGGGRHAVPVWRNALPSRAERSELKRSTIILEAARSFNRAGFHGTSMDGIARRLGVTKAALYRYVPNKHDVLLACFNLAMDSSLANLARAEKEGANGLEKLRIAFRGYLEDLIGTLGHPVVLLEENALLPEQARAIIRRRDEAERRYRSLVKEGIEDGSITPCDPKLAVFALLGAVNWVPKWYRDDGEWSPAEVAESLVNLITRSIAAHPDNRRVARRDGRKADISTGIELQRGEKP